MDSIRAESLRCYVLNRSPLATPTASEGRIRSPQVANEQINVQERWQKHFLGPFDGLVGSIVTCRTCSSQVCMASSWNLFGKIKYFHCYDLKHFQILVSFNLSTATCTVSYISNFSYHCSWMSHFFIFLFSAALVGFHIFRYFGCYSGAHKWFNNCTFTICNLTPYTTTVCWRCQRFRFLVLTGSPND